MAQNGRARCGECRRLVREEDTAEVTGMAGGNWQRAAVRRSRRVCRECTQHQVDYARAGQAEGRNCPVNTSHFDWERAANVFGIEVSGLKANQMTDRVCK